MTRWRFMGLAIIVAGCSFAGGAVATLLLPDRGGLAEFQTLITEQKKLVVQLRDLVKACVARPPTSDEIRRRPPVTAPVAPRKAPPAALQQSRRREAAQRAAGEKRQQIVAWLAKAHEALKAGRYEDAREFYRQVLHLDANNKAAETGLARLEARQQVDSLLQEAAAAFKQKNYNRALGLYAKALSLQPDHAGAKAGLERTEAARAVQIKTLLERAEQALASGKYEAARKLYGRVLALDRDQARAKAGLARLEAVRKSNPAPPEGIRPDAR
jgi:tetratricopeptide (TPR) repeat protein